MTEQTTDDRSVTEECFAAYIVAQVFSWDVSAVYFKLDKPSPQLGCQWFFMVLRETEGSPTWVATLLSGLREAYTAGKSVTILLRSTDIKIAGAGSRLGPPDGSKIARPAEIRLEF